MNDPKRRRADTSRAGVGSKATVGVVTGAASGMGRACVRRLQGQVDHLVAIDITDPKVPGTIGMSCDIIDVDAINRVAGLVTKLGRFRLLAHAAGVSPSMADTRLLFDVNLLGTQRLLEAFEPLVEPESAAVCFSSAAAYIPLEILGTGLLDLLQDSRSDQLLDRAERLIADPGIAYIVSKHGVQLAARHASVRWARRGGRVVSISPGTINTPMARREMEAQPMMHEHLAGHPLHRLGDADEVAAVVEFLLSSDASFVSGIDVLVDGGSQAAELLRLTQS